MKKYIPLDDLVAEIEKLKEENKPNSKSISEYIKGGIYGFDLAIEKTLGILDSFEVKEVDLEKEYEEFVVDDPIFGNFITNDTMGMKLAKHFFELGMRVNNKAQKGEEV